MNAANWVGFPPPLPLLHPDSGGSTEDRHQGRVRLIFGSRKDFRATSNKDGIPPTPLSLVSESMERQLNLEGALPRDSQLIDSPDGTTANSKGNRNS